MLTPNLPGLSRLPVRWRLMWLYSPLVPWKQFWNTNGPSRCEVRRTDHPLFQRAGPRQDKTGTAGRALVSFCEQPLQGSAQTRLADRQLWLVHVSHHTHDSQNYGTIGKCICWFPGQWKQSRQYYLFLTDFIPLRSRYMQSETFLLFMDLKVQLERSLIQSSANTIWDTLHSCNFL